MQAIGFLAPLLCAVLILLAGRPCTVFL